MVTIGIVANPASGKDVRRLVARASVFDNPEKQAIVRRILAGMQSVLDGVDWQIGYLDDAHGIVRKAVDELIRDNGTEQSLSAVPIMTA
jgi:predicted polyphosphate/ATP-dependent NAD kinase